MSAAVVYREIRRLLNQHLDPRVDPNSRERLALLITGILGGKSAAPARVTMRTGLAPRRSRASKSRPRSSGMPMACR